MIEHMHFAFVEETSSLLIEAEGVLLPAVPKALHHLDELGSPRIPRVVVDMLLAIEVAGFGLRPRCDDVPTGAAIADEVECCKFAGKVERLVVGGRSRGDEADVLRHDGQRGQERKRLHLDDLVARARQRSARNIALPDADAIGKEDEIALAVLGQLRAARVMFEAQRAVGWHVGMAPGGGMISQSADRHPEMELPVSHPDRSIASQLLQGCGPQGAAVSSFTSCDMTRGRNLAAKPSTKSVLANTPAQCLRRSASSSNFQRWISWLIMPVSPWK